MHSSPFFQGHMRATFAHLALAYHHLEIANERRMRNEKAKDTPRLQDTQKGLNQTFKRRQAEELKSPFERGSPDLFNRIASLFDAPSLARATAVSRIWGKSILESEETFHNFEMERKEAQLSRGLAIHGG